MEDTNTDNILLLLFLNLDVAVLQNQPQKNSPTLDKLIEIEYEL